MRGPHRTCAWIIGLAALSSLLAPTPAEAHFQSLGLSNFNAGIVHPILTLQHALALVAFGLLCGQNNAVLLRFGLPGLAAGLTFGFAIAYGAYAASALDAPILTALALLAGVSVAASYLMPAWICIGMGFLIGAMIGLDSKPETLDGFLANAEAIAGTLIGVFLLFLNLAGIAAFAEKQWQSIGVRVIGSWTSAAAFLNIALLFRK